MAAERFIAQALRQAGTGVPSTWREVLAGLSRGTTEQGNALAALSETPSECVDATIADPSYSTGGTSRGEQQLTADAGDELATEHALADMAEALDPSGVARKRSTGAL